uniref:Uncharacterized protein n=1 Tax=Physcomitrium patens TaxID=3218 RepID=A0A7I4FD53_PHYPA
CGISYDIKFLRQSSVDSVRAVITQAESHEADEIEELAKNPVKVVNAALSWRPKGHIVVEIHDVEHELWAKQGTKKRICKSQGLPVLDELVDVCIRSPDAIPCGIKAANARGHPSEGSEEILSCGWQLDMRCCSGARSFAISARCLGVAEEALWLRKLNYYTGKEDLKALSLETFDSICIVADERKICIEVLRMALAMAAEDTRIGGVLDELFA